MPRGLPAPWVPPSNPITEEKLALGRRLFFEPAMSRDRTKSCAHCHLPELAFTDGLATAVGVRGQVGARNVPSLLNAAIYPSLFWDGRSVSLESQAEGPLLAPTELDMTEELLVERIREAPAYGPLFAAAFGSETVTLRRIAHALAAFQRTLLAGDAPFDRWWFGKDGTAMTDAAKRGYELFRTKGACAGCHSIRPTEAAFTDGEYHATGTVAKGVDRPRSLRRDGPRRGPRPLPHPHAAQRRADRALLPRRQRGDARRRDRPLRRRREGLGRPRPGDRARSA